MAKMTKEVRDTFNNPKAIKVLATESSEGELNCVPIMSLSALDDETIAFANIFMDKTKKNLNATKKVCATAFILPATPGVTPHGVQVKGTFQEFQTSGPIYEKFREMVQQQMKWGTKGVGIIKVEKGYDITPGTGARQVF